MVFRFMWRTTPAASRCSCSTGGRNSAYLWRNQIPFLVVNGFRVIAPDLRGFGRSDRPDGAVAYSIQNAVGDVAGILDGLGIEAADIVGHDYSVRGVSGCGTERATSL